MIARCLVLAIFENVFPPPPPPPGVGERTSQMFGSNFSIYM